MGWTSSYSWETKQDVVNEVLRDCNWQNQGTVNTAIKHSLRGGNLWVVIERKSPGELAKRYILLVRIESRQGVFSYKDMDESMGPYYYDCPLSFLDLAGPTDNEYAVEWREKVREYHAQKKAKRNLFKSVEVGDVVVLKGRRPSTFRVSSLKPFRGYDVETGHGPYRLIKSAVSAVRMPEKRVWRKSGPI